MSDRYTDDPALYSQVYAHITADIAPLVALMAGAGGPVLEVACGNGRLLVPALEAGVDVDGLDLSRPMLDDLRRTLGARGLETALVEGDMRDFALPRRYALVLVAFNAFLHNLTQADQLATLRCCRGHLAPGGALAIVAFHPHAERLIQIASPGGMQSIDQPRAEGGRLRAVDVAEDDRVEQVRRHVRTITITDGAGAEVRRVIHRFDLRYVFKPEMELLLRAAGFSPPDVRPLRALEDGTTAFVAGAAPAEGDTLLYLARAAEGA